MELLINSNSNSNSWEILLTIAIAIVPKMSIAIVISILLISSDNFTTCTYFLNYKKKSNLYKCGVFILGVQLLGAKC